MSDIYLQITETPTVVTLSAPVVSGALASTVTVANTVTVALDSNSLSALENVTVTVGAAITGTVTVANFPATQPISGTVTANVFGKNVNNGAPVAFPIADGNDNFVEEGPRLGVQLLGTDGLSVGQGSTCILPISGTVTIVSLPAISGTVTASVANSITVGSLPVQLSTTTIGGTSRLNVTLSSATTVGATAPSYGNLSGGSDGTNFRAILTDTSGRTVVTVSNFPATQPVSLASLPSLAAGTAQIGSVTASISGTVPVSISSVTVGNSITIGSCVTHGVTIANTSVTVNGTFFQATQPVSLASLPALAAGTAQIGSVTASISGTVPVSGTFYQATQPVSLTTLPALVAGTAQIGSVTASISNSVVTFYPMQGTSVSNTNFTSTTASTTLVSAVANREVLTVFNEGAGNLHISPGATCTTVAYQVRLSAGDYWECPQGQLSLAHTAVFATAGTARVTQVS